MASSPSLPSWFTFVACNTSSIHQRQSLLQWLGFIFLSPCPQCLLFSAVDAVFLLLLLAFALHKLLSRLINRRRQPDSSDARKPLLSKSALQTDLRFKLALVISSLLTASFAVLLVFALTGRLPRSQWQLAEATFLLLQFLSHLAAAALIAHEKRFRAATHPATLHLFWIASVLLTALLSTSAVVRFVVAIPISPDDVISLVALALSLPLLFLAVSGSTGISRVIKFLAGHARHGPWRAVPGSARPGPGMARYSTKPSGPGPCCARHGPVPKSTNGSHTKELIKDLIGLDHVCRIDMLACVTNPSS